MFAAVHTAITVGLGYLQEAPYWDYIPIVPTTHRASQVDPVTAQVSGDDSDLDDRAPNKSLRDCERL